MSPSRGGVFISYRREDTAAHARLLKVELSRYLPDAQIFMDLDSVEPGLDFTEVIAAAASSCRVLVALIGRQWLTLMDEEGARRLDNPDDYVRFEIRTALEGGVRVIPVLVDDATAPRKQQLPPDLQRLARLNAFEMTHGHYEHDAERLARIIEKVLGPAAARVPSSE